MRIRTAALIVLCLSIALVFVMAFDFPFAMPYANVDFYAYYAGAVLFDQNQNIYSSSLTGELLNGLNLPYIQDSDYIYPPYMALMLSVFVEIPPRVLAAVWGFLNLAALVLSLYWMADLLTRQAERARTFWMFLLLALVFLPTNYALFVGQVNMILLAFVILAFRLDTRGKQRAAGIALGVAILIKVSPILLIGYFLFRRRWGVLAYAGVTIAAVVLITLPWTLEYNLIYVRDVLPSLSTPQAHPVNQSVNGFFSRILTQSVFSNGWVDQPDLSKTFTFVVSGMLAVWGFWAVYRDQRRPERDTDAYHHLNAYLLLLVISVVISPLAWENLYVLLAAPVLLLLFGWRSASQTGRILTIAAIALMIIQRWWAFHGEAPQTFPVLRDFSLLMSLGLYGALCTIGALYFRISK